MEDKAVSTSFNENGQLAHVDYKTGRCQSMKEHVENIIRFSQNICELPVLESLIILGEMLHDVGKLGTENQADLENIQKFGDEVHKHGLDHSTAGGCNRHKELGRMGVVYIVQMSSKAENLKHLDEIKNAQAALQKVLDDFDLNRERFDNTLDSEKAIKAYYLNYRTQLKANETKFSVDVCGVTTTLVELLSKNQIGQNQYCRAHSKKMQTKLPQAFQTAGEKFEVISDNYKVGVVVPYEPEINQLLEELEQSSTETENKKVLRKLQKYTVGISEARKSKLGNAIYENSTGVLVLSDGYYDRKVGVVDEPNWGFSNM